MRDIIFDIIEEGKQYHRLNYIYTAIMTISIFVSLIPLAFKHQTFLLQTFDKVTVALFIVDYFLRLLTADKLLKKNSISFIIYPFTFWAIIDLLSIVPSIVPINRGIKTIRVIKLSKIYRFLELQKRLG